MYWASIEGFCKTTGHHHEIKRGPDRGLYTIARINAKRMLENLAPEQAEDFDGIYACVLTDSRDDLKYVEKGKKAEDVYGDGTVFRIKI